MFDIVVLLFLIVGAITFAYLVYVQNTVVNKKDEQIKNVNELKDQALLEISKKQSEALEAYKRSVQATQDRELLVELIHLIWEARDTEAAYRCVKNLVAPSVDGFHYTIGECYTNLREDLDLIRS